MNISKIENDATSGGGSKSPAPDWFAYFKNSWAMRRSIADRAGGRTGAAKGMAVFSQCGEERALLARENMLIEYGGRRWPAQQEMIWRFDEGRPQLYFSDQRFFCKAGLAREGDTWRAALTHLCGEDAYEGELVILNENSWRLVWRVAGPHKDYTLETSYERALF